MECEDSNTMLWKLRASVVKFIEKCFSHFALNLEPMNLVFHDGSASLETMPYTRVPLKYKSSSGRSHLLWSVYLLNRGTGTP